MTDTVKKTDCTKTFRFKFSKGFVPILENFARNHRWDDPKIFKEKWKHWVKEHKDFIDREVLYLEDRGYEGDVLSKMFKKAQKQRYV